MQYDKSIRRIFLNIGVAPRFDTEGLALIAN